MRYVPSSYLLRFAQLAALWAYSVSQPVFSMLQSNPEFLVVRGTTRVEVVVLAFGLALLAPAVAIACEWLVDRWGSDIGRALHLVCIGAFALPLGVDLSRRLELDAAMAVLVSLGFAVLLLNAYAWFRAVGLFLAASVILPVLGLASFVLTAPVITEDAQPANVHIGSSLPVVILVMDEFPVSSLMTERGRIDAGRYPSFARLARDATWYPRATTVHEHTTGAVPSILTGQLPKKGQLPTLDDHPENLFTLLGDVYRIRSHEVATHLCPKLYCPREAGGLFTRLHGLLDDVRIGYLHRVLPDSLSHDLPELADRWHGFGNGDLLPAAEDPRDVDELLARSVDSPPAELAEFSRRLSRRDSAATLVFFHLLLPHTPWRYLPSGNRYGFSGGIDGIDERWNRWGGDRSLVAREYQRHLLQVGYTDSLVGRFLDRLQGTGLYERAMIVVVADHGASFVAGGSRRTVSRQNIADIARVPLFVKLPGQTRGRVDASPVRTIDILPTIADALRVDLPWGVDGVSLLLDGRRSSQVTVTRRDGSVLRLSVDDVDRAQAATLRRKRGMFGQGSDSLYALGASRHLLGTSLDALTVRRSPSARAFFDQAERLEHVRRSSAFVPSRIAGSIDGPDVGDRELALAINGRIEALTRAFVVNGTQRFAALVPESSLREGRNDVALLVIGGSRAAPRLFELSRA